MFKQWTTAISARHDVLKGWSSIMCATEDSNPCTCIRKCWSCFILLAPPKFGSVYPCSPNFLYCIKFLYIHRDFSWSFIRPCTWPFLANHCRDKNITSVISFEIKWLLRFAVCTEIQSNLVKFYKLHILQAPSGCRFLRMNQNMNHSSS